MSHRQRFIIWVDPRTVVLKSHPHHFLGNTLASNGLTHWNCPTQVAMPLCGIALSSDSLIGIPQSSGRATQWNSPIK